MNSKIALSGLSIFAALMLMGGATFAFFSSSATSTGNVFNSGNLTLKIDDNDELAAVSTVTGSIGTGSSAPLAPGGSVSGFISLDNTGTIDIDHVTLGVGETASSAPSLADVLDVTAAGLSNSSSCTSPTDLLAGWQAQVGLGAPTTLTKLILKGEFNAIPTGLTAGTTKFLCLTFTMESGASNSYQGATTTDTFTFIGKQSSSQIP